MNPNLKQLKEEKAMSLTSDNGFTMPVQPLYGGNYGNGGFGGFGGWGDSIWLIILLLFCGGWGGFGGFGGGFDGGMGLYPWMNQLEATQGGFNQAATNTALSGIQNSITNGFANAEASACNRALTQLQSDHASQIANMNQSFANAQALDARLDSISMNQATCCCNTQAAIKDVAYTVATEACADRAAISDALKDVIAANTASTQKILDQLCQDKIDAKNEKIVELQNQLNMANFRESQTQQNAFFAQGMNAEVDALYNRLSNCPVPSVPVYGRQPIFQCNNGYGCGCNG